MTLQPLTAGWRWWSKLFGQDGAAILCAVALRNPDRHPAGIDIGDLRVYPFGNGQSCAIGGHHQQAMLGQRRSGVW
jgi:hypothetical protein